VCQYYLHLGFLLYFCRTGMGTIYLLYYDFKHTSGNHAGMAYLSQELKAAIPDVRLVRHIRQGYTGGRYVGWIYAVFIALYLYIVLRPGDKVCLMEYMSGHFARQDVIVSLLRKWKRRNFVLGIIHLPLSFLQTLYGSVEVISKKIALTDHILVFGNQLKRDIHQLTPVPITFAHHYAERAYYRPAPNPYVIGQRHLHVLCIGGIKRNWRLLSEIVERCRNIEFHLCVGDTMPGLAVAYPHVHVYKRLDEADLLTLMQRCDVNLSVLEDTVGSNAITSSMAVGLVQVVSRIGSIDDYCTTRDSFLCNGLNDYVCALQRLSEESGVLETMRQATLEAASRFDKEKFIHTFRDLIGIPSEKK